MKNRILILSLFLGLNLIAQTKFEKGYFITENGRKIDCFIKNENWTYTPSSFTYKENKNSDKITKDVKFISELVIEGKVKYIKENVKIDRSLSNINYLSSSRISSFKNERLFLRVLIEGDANLYRYSENFLDRFFFKKDNTIKPLEYKRYKTSVGTIRENKNYALQLNKELSCGSLSSKRVRYNLKHLTNYFNNYNSCINSKISKKYYKINKNKGKFNLYSKASFSLSSLKVKNEINKNDITDFGSISSFKIGAELEYVFGIDDNKWAVFIEPTYQNISTKKNVTLVLSPTSSINYEGTLKYSSIEVPVGIRYYSFFNDKNKLFFSAGAIVDLFVSGEFKRNIISSGNIVPTNTFAEIKTSPTLFSGIGFALNNKYRIEIQYNFNRELFSNTSINSNDFTNFSIKIGYNFL